MKYINENPTKTEKMLFEKYGLYLIYKDEDSYRKRNKYIICTKI